MTSGLRWTLAAALVAALALLPAAAGASSHDGSPPELEAAAWALVDARTGERLAGRRADRPMPVASATKLMTARVAMRRLSVRDVVRAADYEAAPAESLLGLEPGELVTVGDLIDGLILASGNDAAVTLAEAAAGSVPAFVELMNREAERLGLEETRFANPIGLDEPGNHSSAADLAELGRRLMADPQFRSTASARQATLRSLEPPMRIENRNTLLEVLPWADGIKTGHTLDAGYVLVGSGSLGGVRLVSVVLGAETMEQRDRESLRLLEYGMSLYEPTVALRRGELVEVAEIRHGDGRLGLRAARSVRFPARADQQVRVATRVPDEVEGPIARGEALGVARTFLDGTPGGRVRLLAGRSVPEPGALRQLSGSPWVLSAAAVAVLFGILTAGALVRRRRRPGGDGDWMSLGGGSQPGAGRQSDRNGEP